MTVGAPRKAVAKVDVMPVAEQERIGRNLGAYVEDLGVLREMLDEGIRSLDAGLGKEIDIEQVIVRARMGL